MHNKYLLFFILIAALFIGCAKSKNRAGNFRYIKTMIVEKGPYSVQRRFSGISNISQESDLAFQVSGKIKKIAVKLGEEAEKGSIIAELDATDFKNNFQAAQSQYEEAKKELARYRLLYENENISQQQYEAAKTKLKVLTAKLNITRTQLEHTLLKAPFRGKIAKVYLKAYEVVSAGQPVVRLQGEGAIEVVFGVPSVLVGKIKPGQDAEVYFEELPGKVFSGKVSKVGSALDEKTATFKVVVKIASYPKSLLRPGMVADVKLKFEKKNNVFRVPLSAVLEDMDKNKFVWIYEPKTNIVHKQKITVGLPKDDFIEVTSGLAEGQIIAVAGAAYLKEGEKVKPIPEKEQE